MGAIAAWIVGVAAIVFSYGQWRSSAKAEEDKRDDELLAWGSKCLDAMSSIEALALHECYWTSAEFNLQKTALAAKTSALLDEGRIFFPNVNDEGRTDPTGKGLRPKILDELRLAYLVAEDLTYGRTEANEQRRNELWDARGAFVRYLRIAVNDKRKRLGEAGMPGRSVALAPLEQGNKLRRTHRR